MRMLVRKHLLFTLYIFFCLPIYFYSQNNSIIQGKVIDSESGQPIIGANVLIENTNIGSATDLDGYYSIKNLKSGNYSIIASYISYTKTKISEIKLNENESLIINISLKPETIELKDEVIVLGEVSNQYEAALLNQRKKSLQLFDGLSAEIIKRTPDSNTAESLRRVPGITLMDGKFIFVRGVSERYSGALLNNSPLASTEPDKKDFAFDLIPASLIENTMVIKSFTPDEPGDFAGGLVKVKTVDFPTRPFFSVGYTTSFTNNSSTKTFLSYQGGSTDWLGIDDGTRALPENFPATLTGLTRFQDTLYQIAKTLKNTWPNIKTKSPLNRDFKLNYGDIFQLFDQPIGMVLSLTYKDDYSINSLVTRDLNAEGMLFDYTGNKFARNVHWGALLNLAYKFDLNNKVMFKNNFTQDADDETFIYRGDQYDRSSNIRTNALRFVSRSLYSTQIAGESVFPFLDDLRLDWRYSYSQSLRDEPDYRRYYYSRNLESTNEADFLFAFPATPSLREGGRFYSDLSEYRRGYNFDISKSFGNFKFKTGAAYSHSNRDFNSRLIGMLNPFNVAKFRRYSIDSLFNPENFYLGGLAIGEYVNATNKYSAGDEVLSFYLMAEIPFSVFDENFVLVLGGRNENYLLRLRTNDPFTGLPLNLDYINPALLPSLNLIYKFNDLTNIRFSYSRTINRPQFREVAPFNYYDFQDQTNIGGNIELKEARISNVDLRIETFPGIDELISFSLFYKEIKDPIEKVILASSSNNVRTFINGPLAKNWGFEAEARTSLGFISNSLNEISFSGNYTRLWSEIQEFQVGAPSRKRRMQGQSPYVVNLALNYASSYLAGSVSLAYYRFGPRLVETASIFNSDWVEQPRDIVDLIITKELWNNIEMKLTVKDLLAQEYQVLENKILVRQKSTNTKVSLGVSFKL